MATEKVVLVTGGAGYVGSHTTLLLLQEGYNVIVVDNLVNAYKDSAPSATLPESLIRVQKLSGKSVTFYAVDLLNKDDVSKIFKNHKIDCVIHFAALKAVGESCQIPLTYYHNNITGAVYLLQVMKEFGVRNLVYSSSSTVYGTPQSLPLNENHPTGQGCTNPYGKSKYFVEEIMKDLCTSDKSWNIISLRYFNPVGAHPSGEIGEDPSGIPNNLMPYISQVAVGRRPKLLVFGNDYNTPDGTGVRDYIHIMDLAEGHSYALKKLYSPGFTGFKPYNLGTGSGYSVLDLVKAFTAASGKEIAYEFVGRREGDIATSYCDAGLAEKELGWKSKRTIKEMCEDTWRWQSKNPDGYHGSS